MDRWPQSGRKNNRRGAVGVQADSGVLKKPEPGQSRSKSYPAELLKQISSRTRLVTSSIGAGSGGDIQFMFAEDILGNHAPPYPRHTKQYRNLFQMEQALQAERVGVFETT